jgi:hypothetical protein
LRIFAPSLDSAFFADFNSSLSLSLYATKIPQTFNNGIQNSNNVGKKAIALETI